MKSPDEAPSGMTARRMADALEQLGRDLAATSIKLLTCRHYLPDAVLGREYESLRALAERMGDASVSVRVGTVPIESHAGAHQPPRPLIDAIEAATAKVDKSPTDSIAAPKPARKKPPPVVIEPDYDEPEPEPEPEKPPRKPARKTPGFAPSVDPATLTDDSKAAFRAALDAIPKAAPPRAWIVRRAKTGEYLGRVTGDNLTRAQLAAEERWSHVDRKALDVRPAPSGDDDAEEFHDQFDAPKRAYRAYDRDVKRPHRKAMTGEHVLGDIEAKDYTEACRLAAEKWPGKRIDVTERPAHREKAEVTP